MEHYLSTGIQNTVPSGTVEHQYGEYNVTRESTYTLQGTQQRTCQVCGDTQTSSLPLKHDSDNLEDYLAVDYEVVNGEAIDIISGSKLNTVIDGDYFKGGTIKLPQSYSSFTLELIVDYNENSTKGIIKDIYFRDNNNKYDGTDNVLRIEEIGSAT